MPGWKPFLTCSQEKRLALNFFLLPSLWIGNENKIGDSCGCEINHLSHYVPFFGFLMCIFSLPRMTRKQRQSLSPHTNAVKEQAWFTRLGMVCVVVVVVFIIFIQGLDTNGNRKKSVHRTLYSIVTLPKKEQPKSGKTIVRQCFFGFAVSFGSRSSRTLFLPSFYSPHKYLATMSGSVGPSKVTASQRKWIWLLWKVGQCFGEKTFWYTSSNSQEDSAFCKYHPGFENLPTLD